MSNPLLRFILGIGIVGAIIMFVDNLLQVLYLFAMVVLVPLMLLAGAGLITESTFAMFKEGSVGWIEKLRDGIGNWRNEFETAEEAEEL